MRRCTKIAIFTLLLALIIPTVAQAKKKDLDLKDFSVPPNFAAKVSKYSSIGAIRAGMDSKNFLTPEKSIVFEAAPTFEWNFPQCSDSDVCRIAVYKEGNKRIKIQEYWDVRKNQFTVGNDGNNLMEGQVYSFVVEKPEKTALGEEEKGTADGVYFYVLSKTDREKILGDLNKISKDDEDTQDIAEMNLYIDQGIWFEAINKINKLIAKYPDNNDLVKFKDKLYTYVQDEKAQASEDE